MNRISLTQLMPATASVLIHLGAAGVVVLTADFEPVRMPALMAELVVADPPPVVEARPPAPRPVIRERRPITSLKPVAAPPPFEAPARARPEPEPPKPAAPEPPAVATPEPDAPTSAASEPVQSDSPPPAAAPSAPATDLSLSAVPDTGATAFTRPAPTAQSAGDGTPSPSPRASGVAAVPPDGVTHHAMPRGDYQYRPAYPSTARSLGIQGTTLLHVLVASDGRVAEVLVKQSAGHSDLDRAAVNAARRWRFEPARNGTEPVEMWVQLPFEFRLR